MAYQNSIPICTAEHIWTHLFVLLSAIHAQQNLSLGPELVLEVGQERKRCFLSVLWDLNLKMFTECAFYASSRGEVCLAYCFRHVFQCGS